MTSSFVELIDGRVVERDAEEWRRETEARYVLSLKSLDERRMFLSVVESKRGKPAADALRETMTQIHEASS